MYIKFKLLSLTLLLNTSIFSSVLDEFYWLLTQTLPNYNVSQSKLNNKNEVYHGMSWEATPLFIAFFPNRFVSRYSFLKVQPVDRMSGGLEFFTQSSYYPSDNENNFWLHQAGARFFIPLIAQGEVLGLKVGGSYSYLNQKNGYSLEAGFYFYYSLFDITLQYHFNIDSQFTASFNLRYF